jgi:PAS domain S-box-containing protein
MDAAGHQPVKLEGVLTFVDATNYMSFLQDESGGVYFNVPDRSRLKIGDRVRLTGVTAAGEFTPVVQAKELSALGAAPIPAARRATFAEFESGQIDAEWVELEGRVRLAELENGWLRLKVAVKDGIINARVHDPAGLDPGRLIAAEIRIRGVCAGAFGWEREILDFELYTPYGSDIEVMGRPPLADDKIPVKPIAQIQRDWRDSELIQARCRGTVTLHWPGQFLFVEDQTGSMEIRTAHSVELSPGDEVEALGFRVQAHRTTILDDCSIRRISSGPAPLPKSRTLKDIYSRLSHGELASLEGVLAEIVNQPRIRRPSSSGMKIESEPVLVMKMDQWFLRAELPSETDLSKIALLRPGSRLELSGVIAADTANANEPLTYSMLLQSPNAVRVTAPASWWTVPHIFEIAAVAGLGAISALGFAVGIAHQRRQQAERAVNRNNEQTIRHQAILLELAKLTQSQDEGAGMARLLETVATTLEVARVSVWRLGVDRKILRCLDFHERERGHRGGEELPTALLPAYFAAVADSRVIAAHDARNDPRTRELAESYLIPNGIRSMLDAPLRLRGESIGVLCLEHTGEMRQWTPAEQNFAAAAADQLLILLESGERSRTERALRESEEKFARAFYNSPDALVITTLDTERYLEVNEGFCRLSGCAKNEILGKTASDLSWVLPEDRFGLLGRLRAGERIRDYETQITARAGERRDVVVSCDVMELAGHRCMIGVIHDETERKRAERALREAHAELELRVMLRTTQLAEARDRAESADRIKSAFLAAMSHELRTPLNSIIGFTGIIHQGLVGPTTNEQKKQLGMVMNSARHLLSLINDVLDISKIEANQVELASDTFDLRDAITRVCQIVSPLAARKGLPVHSIISPEVGTIVSDRRRVEQILINLINNAIKFTERGEVRVECEVRNRDAVMRIVDTGIGIRPENIEKLFKPFQQLDAGLARQHEGTGLGLAICRRLARLLGGEISVQSEFQKGSVFTVKLPVEKAARK